MAKCHWRMCVCVCVCVCVREHNLMTGNSNGIELHHSGCGL